MEVLMSMEIQHRRMSAFEGLERFLPYPSSGVRSSRRYRKRTGTNFVGKGHTLREE